MRISVFGLGYVGAVTMACLADVGHRLVGIDVDRTKVDALNRGESPISEPGLEELLRKAHRLGRVKATTDVCEALDQSDLAIVCVGTPSALSGGTNDEHVQSVTKQICNELRNADRPRTFSILVRSTCLPEVHERLQAIVAAARQTPDLEINYLCHPEFLREGSAVSDFFDPPKIVFGTATPEAGRLCRELYPGFEAPTSIVSIGVAAMIKYADNCFHAAKVTFANEIGILCKAQSVDSRQVMSVLCDDKKLNISEKYLRPGAPYGGSCLPKDLRAVLDLSRRSAVATPMLSGIAESNTQQVEAIVSEILASGRRNVGIVGLTFKEDTDDLRESPAVAIAEQLLGKGLRLRIFDSYLRVEQLVGANRSFALESIPRLSSLLFRDLMDVVRASDIVLCFHRIEPAQWSRVESSDSNPRIIDFTDELPQAEGIYW